MSEPDQGQPEQRPPSARVAWDRGGEATLVSFDGDRLVVLSTVPAAPGTPLRGRLVHDGGELPLELKVHGSKRTPEGRFTITGRVVSITRELRATLAAHAAAG